MTERVIHQFPPGEYTRACLVHDGRAGDDPRRSLCYLLVNKGINNGGVVLARMTRADLGALGEAIVKELLDP